LVALAGAPDRFLPGPVPLAEQPADVGRRVRHSKLPVDHFPHALPCPMVAAEAAGNRPLAEQRAHSGLLLRGEPGRRTGGRVAVERDDARLAGYGEPLADRSSADPQSLRDLMLGPTLLGQLPGAQTTAFP